MQNLVRIGLVTLTMSLMAETTVAQDAVQWRVEDGGNGHWYSRMVFGVDTSGYLCRDAASQLAAERGGRLICIGDVAEADFLATNFECDQSGPYWIGLKCFGENSSIDSWVWDDGTPLTEEIFLRGGNWSSASHEDDCGIGWPCKSPLEWGVNSLEGCWQDVNGAFLEYSADCNGDGIVDYGQILDGTLADENGNGVPDTCDALDLNGDGSLDADQLMVALPRSIGSNQTLGDITVDALGTVFAGNNNNTGGSIYRITGLNAPVAYGPSLSDPDTVCINEGPIFSEFPETTILIGREDRITALNTDDSTVDVLSGGSAFDNVNALHVGADGRLGWVALTPNPIQRSTWSDGSVSTFGLLDWDCLSATNDAEGRTWFNEGTKIVRSDGDPATDHVDIGTCVLPVAFKAGLGEALSGGVLVLDRDQLRWIDTETLEELQILDLAGLPELPEGLLNDSVDRYIAINGANDHVVISIVKSDGANPGASEYAMYDLFLSTDDCDENGEPDWRQIARDGSLDSDGSAVLDVCEQPGGYDGILDVPSEYATIQEAVDECPEGGTVLVAPGTYVGTGSSVITLPGRGINIIGDGESTIIDGGNVRRGLAGTGAANSGSIIDGFTFTNCHASGGSDADGTGGGLYLDNVDATVRNCVFISNTANLHGGGMCVFDGTVRVEDCSFTDNETISAGQHGGGLYFDGHEDSVTVFECGFAANSATGKGGGFAIWHGMGYLTDCVFNGNTSPRGGGIDVCGGTLNLEGCTLSENNAVNGAGMYVAPSSLATVFECLFFENESSDRAGGIYCYGSSVTITKCVFAGNTSPRAGAIQTLGETEITECFITGNTSSISGGAICTEGPTSMGNSVLCGNTPNQISSCTGNGGYNDLGGNSIVESCEEYLSDCNGDEVPDIIQIFDGTLEDCDGNGVPDDCELTESFAASEPRTSTGFGDVITFDVGAMGDASEPVTLTVSALGDYLAIGSFMIVSLEGTSFSEFIFSNGQDCVEMSTTLQIPAADWNLAGLNGDRTIRISGTSIQPTLCEPDRFTAIAVEVPLALQDCNDNGLWDSCEIADGSALDSDGDGLLDDCDGCPTDPEKTDEGLCGCGTPDTDSDEDGTPDCIDLCPNWPFECSDGGAIVVVEGRSIQDAINLVSPGGMIEIEAGTFQPNATLDPGGKAMTIRGASDESNGAPLTILDGQNSIRVIICQNGEGSDTIFENLVIQNGRANGDCNTGGCGGGMRNSGSSPTIVNCTFTGNWSGDEGGGMYNTGSSPTVTECLFDGNYALDEGGGMRNWANSDPVVTACTFTGNSTNYGGGMSSHASAPTIDNCTFENNTEGMGRGGGAYFQQSHATLNNSSFSANSAGEGGGLYITDDSDITLNQCLFDQNISFDGGAIRCQNSDLNIVECDFDENQAQHPETGSGGRGGAVYGVTSNISFTKTNFDLNEANVGAAVYDQGNISSSYLTCEFTRNTSPTSPAMDISNGGDVSIANCTFQQNLATTGGFGVISSALLINGNTNAVMDECEFNDNTVENTGGSPSETGSAIVVISPAVLNLNSSQVCGNQPGQITGVFEDLGGNCVTDTCDSDLDGTLDCVDGCPDDPDKIDPGACGCGNSDQDTDADGLPDCVDPCPEWPNDCSEDGQTLFVAVGQSIQNAIDLVPAGGTVEIAAGSYTPGAPLDTQGRAMTVIGAPLDADGLPTTILDGLNTHRVLQCVSGEGPDTVFENLWITGGAAIAETAPEYRGGGMYNEGSSPTLRSCWFVANATSNDGGGMANYSGSSPILEFCVFIDNTARFGGALANSNESSPLLSDCTVENNEAIISGGGLYSEVASVPELIDSVVCGNLADQIAGGYDDLGGNCILEDCGSDLDGNGVPDACDPDCNGDGTPDGLETDCDGDGVPDDCAIADGLVEDCNANGIPDTCDIADGTDADVNGNDVPDNCEYLSGDLDLDGCIGGADLATLLALWGLPNPPIGDLNGDGIIAGQDLATLLANWEPCP